LLESELKAYLFSFNMIKYSYWKTTRTQFWRSN